MALVKLALARKLIRLYYGNKFEFQIKSKERTIGVRPVYERSMGIPTLCWHKQQDGMVKIGQLELGVTINWNWQPEEYREGYDGELYRKFDRVQMHPDRDPMGSAIGTVVSLTAMSEHQIYIHFDNYPGQTFGGKADCVRRIHNE